MTSFSPMKRNGSRHGMANGMANGTTSGTVVGFTAPDAGDPPKQHIDIPQGLTSFPDGFTDSPRDQTGLTGFYTKMKSAASVMMSNVLLPQTRPEEQEESTLMLPESQPVSQSPLLYLPDRDIRIRSGQHRKSSPSRTHINLEEVSAHGSREDLNQPGKPVLPELSRTASTNTVLSYNPRSHLPGFAMDHDNSDTESIMSTTPKDYLLTSEEKKRLDPLKAGGLSREFWMRDENASECFNCGRTFSTWRRKHHCRICGQIFCSSCTKLIDGSRFNQQGRMRCCVPCLDMLEKYGSSSSSQDELTPQLDDSTPIKISFNHEPQPTPTMAVPTTRTGESLEIPFGSFDKSLWPGGLSRHNTGGKRRPRAKTETAASRLSIRNSSSVDFGESSGTSVAVVDSNDEEDEEEDERAMSLFSALHSDLSGNEFQGTRNASYRRARSGTNKSIELGKMGGMRIGQRRRKSLPTLGRRVTLSRSNMRLRPANSINSLVPNDSTKYVGGTPSSNIDLNKASVHHANLLLSQLLESYELSKRWLALLMKPLLLCTENIDLDIKGGDSIDIRHYVKIKPIPGGSPLDTQYIDGVVFAKSLSLKSMPRKVENPRILLITFPLEYNRTDQHYMSLDPVLAQEKEYLKNLVKRVLFFGPQILVTSERVSGLAVKLLADEGVVVITNVKMNVISRIARYCQSDIISSMDKLAVKPRLGQCGLFEARTYRQGDIARTYMFFTGIPKRFGCTILLRGSTMEVLSHIKAVVQFMVYVVFSLKLETSLMRDQFVLVPPEDATGPVHHHDLDFGYFHDLIRLQEGKVLSSSPFVHYGIPYLLQVARSLEDQLVEMERESESLESEEDEQIFESLLKLVPEINIASLPGNIKSSRDIVKMIGRERLERVREQLNNQKRQWELSYAQFPYMFSPSSHQGIVLLHSTVSFETRAPCVGPELLGIEFYGDSDRTLGQYIEELCAIADESCAEDCGRTQKEHYQNYVFGNGRINVVVEPFECRLPGLQDTILMWSHCKICKTSMPVLPMSATTWKYSLGKYFELSFLSSEISFRAGVCSHNLYRDHVRYFGFHDLAVRFEYEPINLFEIFTPGPKPTWLKSVNLGHKVGLYNSIHGQVVGFYDSVLNRLSRVIVEGLDIEKVDECKVRVDELRQRAEKEKADCLAYLNKIYFETEFTEIIPLNAVVRRLQEFVVRWDAEFTDFENNFFPSEKDIARITAQQLKKLFLIEDTVETPEKETPLVTPYPEREVQEIEKEVVKLAKTENSLSTVTRDDFPERTNTLSSVAEYEESSKSDRQEMNYPSSDEDGKKKNGVYLGREENECATDLAPSTSTIHETKEESVVEETSSSRREFANRRRDRLAAEVQTSFNENEKQNSIENPVTAKRTSGDSGQMPGPSEPKQRSSVDESKKHRSSVSSIPVPINRASLNRLDGRPELKKGQSKSRLFQKDDGQGNPSFRKKFSERISFPTQSWRQRFGINPKEFEKQLSGGSKNQNRVSTLAKHFDLLSMEFEKERARERSRLAQGRVRAFPVSSSKPIVEVYRDAQDAVDEVSDDEETRPLERVRQTVEDHRPKEPIEGLPDTVSMTGSDEQDNSIDAIIKEALPSAPRITRHDSEISTETIPDAVTKEEATDLHQMPEKQSLMQTLASFWADRSATGWKPLAYPLEPSEHIFADSDVIVREDEPSSLIAFCLSSPDYLERIRKNELPVEEQGSTGLNPTQSETERWMLKKTGVHLKYQFEEGSAKLSCKIFFAEQFDAFRRQCQFQDEYIQSLSRCVKWDSSGGKSGSAFLKTIDDKLVVKQLSPAELDAFMKFAPSYFEYMAQAFFHELPTVLAKIFGFYQIQIRNPLTGKTLKMDLLVMENLFYKRKISRVQ